MGFIRRMSKVSVKIINFMQLKFKHVEYGSNLRINGVLKIIGSQNCIHIGNNVTLNSNVVSNPLGGSTELIIVVSKHASLIIGDNVGISNTCIRISSSLVIEDNVNIGGDCKIYDSDMHSVDYKYRICTPDIHIQSSPITIEEGAWIGAHSIILKGVHIGKRSVVAAGSVVTKSIPDDELWGGNPARFIKKINIE